MEVYGSVERSDIGKMHQRTAGWAMNLCTYWWSNRWYTQERLQTQRWWRMALASAYSDADSSCCWLGLSVRSNSTRNRYYYQTWKGSFSVLSKPIFTMILYDFIALFKISYICTLLHQYALRNSTTICEHVWKSFWNTFYILKWTFLASFWAIIYVFCFDETQIVSE